MCFSLKWLDAGVCAGLGMGWSEPREVPCLVGMGAVPQCLSPRQ